VAVHKAWGDQFASGVYRACCRAGDAGFNGCDFSIFDGDIGLPGGSACAVYDCAVLDYEVMHLIILVMLVECSMARQMLRGPKQTASASI